jgi:hypothetical protein
VTGFGAEGFIENITRLCLHPRVEAGLVLYQVEPVDGARAGTLVDTAVAIDELSRWPQVPPHWIHLPSSVVLARTNSQPSPRADWTMHSRQITGWGRDADPARGWVGHVRAVLSEATS